jgi:ribosomal protein L11 methyltransferase
LVRLVIKPAWEEYEPQENEVIIDIDPGMAFGTGIHASTRFCLLFMDKYMHGGEKVIDAGCGSGILSIAAAKLGAANIFAMDVDDLAVKIARENAKLNGVEDKIQIEEGNIIEFLEKHQPDLIFANITAEVIALFIPEVAKHLHPGGYLFGSGIVEPRWPGVKKQLDNYGFEIEEVLHDVDWIGALGYRCAPPPHSYYPPARGGGKKGRMCER